MSSILGNTENIKENESKRNLSDFYAPVPVKQAQRVLAQDETDASQWQLLSQELYKCAVKSSTNSGDFLRDATQVVIDWGSDLKEVSFAVIKGYLNMKLLLNWQKEFITILQNQKNTLEIHIFKLYESYNVWVVVSDPSTGEILNYSELYIDFLHKYSTLYFEFIAFGKDEITDLPDDTITIAGEV